MPIALDFATARPTIAQLQAADVTVVCRYVTGGGKAIGLSELHEYMDNDIGTVFVFENNATDAQGGYSAGVANAAAAVKALKNLGVTGVPIYFAVDQDIVPAGAVNYFQGINVIIQPAFVGIYGEGALCALLQSEGLATWFWQSESTSFPGNDVTLPITHMLQRFGNSPIPGTDFDVLCKRDVGQWPRPAPSNPTTVPGDLFTMLASDPDFAVRYLYRFCLHREADATGFTTGVDFLNGGGTLNQLMTNLQDSAEGQAVITAERKALGLA